MKELKHWKKPSTIFKEKHHITTEKNYQEIPTLFKTIEISKIQNKDVFYPMYIHGCKTPIIHLPCTLFVAINNYLYVQLSLSSLLRIRDRHRYYNWCLALHPCGMPGIIFRRYKYPKDGLNVIKKEYDDTFISADLHEYLDFKTLWKYSRQNTKNAGLYSHGTQSQYATTPWMWLLKPKHYYSSDFEQEQLCTLFIEQYNDVLQLYES